MAEAKPPVIAIDGPGGSGKGTVSRRVAEQLGWHFLDSGALYRLMALAVMERRMGLEDTRALGGLAERLDVRFEAGPAGTRILLEGKEVTESIRREACGDVASRVAAVPEVRAGLIARQHAFRQPPGLVADGRDMGTVVFSDAQVKVFLTASAEARAKRRHKQLKEKGIDVMLPALLDDIIGRDRRDTNRAVSPLVPAADAVVIDSTEMSVEAVVEQVLSLWRQSAARS